jgi:hypothetical protein
MALASLSSASTGPARWPWAGSMDRYVARTARAWSPCTRQSGLLGRGLDCGLGFAAGAVLERGGARIDRLSTSLQEMLKVACAEGEAFTAEVVARVQGAPAFEIVAQLIEHLAIKR